MTDANATEARIDTNAHETMIGTRDHDRVVEVRVGGGNHEHVVQAQNIQRTVAQNHLLLYGTGMVRESTRDPIRVMVLDTVAGVQIT
jgi:hypothetical protein